MPALLGELANGTAAAYVTVQGVNSTILAAIGEGTKSAYAASFKTVYLSTLAFGFTALIVSFFTTDINEYMTSFVNKTVSGKDMHANSEKVHREILEESGN